MRHFGEPENQGWNAGEQNQSDTTDTGDAGG